MGLLYVSNGNIPSRWAHTIQIMKMSEALAQLVEQFALVIPGDLAGAARRPADIFGWYGIQRPFRLARLPMAWRLRPDQLERSNWRRFSSRARVYTWFSRPRLIWTRCHESADYALRDGFPLIFETHDGPGHPKTMDAIAAFAKRSTLAGVVTTSEVLAEAFRGVGLPGEKILVIPNAVEPERFRVSPAVRDVTRAELGLTEAEFLVIYTGSLKAYKGIPTLIEAARLRPDFRFLTVGGSPDEVEHWQGESGNAKNLRFIPFVPNQELPRYLAAADACLVPNSASDRTAAWTFSLKLYEYMAAERPIVASAIPSLASVIRDEETGLLVAPDDPRALATALDRLHGDRDLAQAMAKRARDVAASLTWHGRAKRVLETFAPTLLAPRRHRGAP